MPRNHEVVGDDEAHVAVAAAAAGPVSVPPAASPAVPAVPTFTPRINSEGHRKICQIVLPLLLGVCGEPLWCAKPPRDQVRETLDSPVAADVTRIRERS